MKKSLLILTLLSIILTISGQDGPVYLNPTVERSITASQCPPGTYYSHTMNYVGSFSSCSVYKVFDRIESTPAGPVDLITFYGKSFTGPNQSFDIGFCKSMEGMPGPVYYSLSTTIEGTIIEPGELTLIRYACKLPAPVNIEAGDWMYIYATGDNWWYWCMANGGDGCVDQEGYGHRCDFGDAAFCLGQSKTEYVIPVADWALGLGLLLIATLAVLRYRRIF